MAGKLIYLGFGSNIGDRERQIREAMAALPASGIHITRASSLYETEPVGVTGQAWFLNSVAEAETTLMPRQTLAALMRVELALGRKRITQGAPRTIDMDLLLYGNSVMRARDIEVPHPRMAERRFVLVPLAEIVPTLRHPVLNQSIAEILEGLRDPSQVRLWRQPVP